MAQLIPYAIAAVGVVTAGGQLMQGQAQAKAYKQSADLAEQQSRADAASQRIRAGLQTGAAAAQYGASGLSFEGTPTDMLAQSAMYGELDAQNILYKGSVKAYGLRQQAADAKRAGMINAASTLLTSATSAWGASSMLGGGAPVKNVTGTASSGGNVRIVSGSYTGG